MSDCKHPNITTWVYPEGDEIGQPSGLWSCRECGLKFVPMTELDEGKAELEAARVTLKACAKLRDYMMEHGEGSIVDWAGKDAVDWAIHTMASRHSRLETARKIANSPDDYYDEYYQVEAIKEALRDG